MDAHLDGPLLVGTTLTATTATAAGITAGPEGHGHQARNDGETKHRGEFIFFNWFGDVALPTNLSVGLGLSLLRPRWAPTT